MQAADWLACPAACLAAHGTTRRLQNQRKLKKISYLTKLGVVAAEGDELFADGAAAVGLPLALLGVGHHPLHLVTAWQSAVGVSALAGVDEALYAPLDAQLPRLLGVARRHRLPAAPVQVEPKLLHLVRVAIVLVAHHTTHATKSSQMVQWYSV